MRELLKKIGYQSADDAIHFVMAGIAFLPALLMLSGFVAAGAASQLFLILLLAVIGISMPPPPSTDPHSEDHKKTLK